MQKRRVLIFCLGLLAGIAIGFGIAILIGAIARYRDSGTPFAGPKTFGEVKVAVADMSNDANCNSDNIPYMMLITRAGTPFLAIGFDTTGRVKNVSVVGEENTMRFTMNAREGLPGWKNAMYGRQIEAKHTVGEVYIDNNFDGQFDTKVLRDDSGQKISRSIYLDGTWKEIDRDTDLFDPNSAYIFDPNSGWHLQ